jgi:transposase
MVMKNYNSKYIVRLSAEELEILDAIMRKGRVDAGKRRRAQILLKADAASEGSGPTDEEVARALDVSARTIHQVRKRYVEQGLIAAVERKPRVHNTARKLDGEGEARLIALACGPAPQGCARWTLRLLAKKLVELKIVDTISKDAVRETLKKTSLSLG